MKAKAFILVLIIVALGLGVGMIVLTKNATEEKQQADNKIRVLSNNVASVQASLEEQRTVNLTLETNLVQTKEDYSNKLTATKADLDTANANYAKAQADAKAAAEAAAAEVAQRDKKIADLESQNQELDKQSTDLRGSITNLEAQISSTEKKLATSEGDREFLLKELKRLQVEKADLEKKFNDLAVLRDQVKKLKDELSISRRLDWIRRGIYSSFGQKGAERLLHPVETLPPATNTALNVELREDGGVKVTPVSATNAPAAK
jgi:chromosome segregation ATPase